MTRDERLLKTLQAPVGGWERLRDRRDARASGPRRLPGPATGTAAAVAAAIVAVVIVATFPDRTPLPLPPGSARLLDSRAPVAELRLRGNGSVTPLPATEPRVRLYWMEGG